MFVNVRAVRCPAYLLQVGQLEAQLLLLLTQRLRARVRLVQLRLQRTQLKHTAPWHSTNRQRRKVSGHGRSDGAIAAGSLPHLLLVGQGCRASVPEGRLQLLAQSLRLEGGSKTAADPVMTYLTCLWNGPIRPVDGMWWW